MSTCWRFVAGRILFQLTPCRRRFSKPSPRSRATSASLLIGSMLAPLAFSISLCLWGSSRDWSAASMAALSRSGLQVDSTRSISSYKRLQIRGQASMSRIFARSLRRPPNCWMPPGGPSLTILRPASVKNCCTHSRRSGSKMQISALRKLVADRLLAFAWNEWAQIGILTDVLRESPWATDPEALLLFSLQVGRSDARLFDETLDWLARNSGLISIQRFRNHYASDRDGQIGEAAVAWLAGQVPAHLQPRKTKRVGEPERLFYGGRAPSRPDPAFLQYGLLKQTMERSRKSQPPDLTKPINFAFRLRRGFGVGSRAEVMRFLLTATRLSRAGSRPLFTTL